jgi:uncharacterized integral membrane protein
MRWLLFLPLLVLLALFALSNPQDVELRLWPFDLAWVSPLGIAVLVLGAVAFVFGAVLTWAAGWPARRRAARMEEAAKLLEGELAAYKAREEEARKAADLGRPVAQVLPAPELR